MNTAIKRPTVEAPFSENRDEAQTSQFQPAIDFFRLEPRRHRQPVHPEAANEGHTPINPNEI